MPLWLLKIGGLLKSIPWQIWALAAALLAGWLYGNARFDAGEAAEKARTEAAVAAALQEQREQFAAALADDTVIVRQGEAAIDDKRKELDDETATLPDRPLTARQRARACQLLRRQGSPCPDPGGSGTDR